MVGRIARATLIVTFLVLANGCQQAVRRGSLAPAPHAAQGDSVFVADDRGRIHALSSDGAERWIYEFATELEREHPTATSDLAAVEIASAEDGSIAVLLESQTGSTAGQVFLVRVDADGRALWHRTVDPPSPSARPCAVGRAVYVAMLDGSLRAFALDDGRDLWTFTISGAALGSPRIGGDGTIYVRGASGRLHAVSPDGKELWVFAPPE